MYGVAEIHWWHVSFQKHNVSLEYYGDIQGPEAVQSHQNDSCYKSVLCFI